MKSKKTSDKITASKDKFLNIILILFFSVFPLFVWHDYGNITEVKLKVFYVLSFAAVAISLYLLLGMILDGVKIKFPEKQRLLPYIFLFAYLIINLLSYIFSPYDKLVNSSVNSAFWFGSGRYDGYFVLLIYAALFIIFSNIKYDKKILVITCSLTAFVMGIIGVIQRFGINIFGFYPIDSFDGRWNNFISTIGNSDIFACFVCIFVPIIAVAYIIFDYKKLFYPIIFLSISMLVFLILTSKSGAGLLSLLFTFSVVVPLLQKSTKHTAKTLDIIISFLIAVFFNETIIFQFVKQYHKYNIKFNFNLLSWLIIFAVILLVVFRIIFTKTHKEYNAKKVTKIIYTCEAFAVILFLLGIYFIYKPKENGINKDLISEIYYLLHGKIDDTSGTYRIGIWKRAIKAGTKHLWLGTGMGSFIKVFYEQPAEKFTLIKNAVLDNAHSEYIQTFVVSGILGLGSYVAFLISTFVTTLRNKNSDTIIVASAIICYCVQALFNFSIVITAPFLWICLGLLLSEKNRREK